MHLPSIKIKRNDHLSLSDRLSMLRVPTLHAVLRVNIKQSSNYTLKLKTEGSQSYKPKKGLSTIEPSKTTMKNPTNFCQLNLNKYSLEK